MKNILHPIALGIYLVTLSFFFAHVEIQIEGAAGWAASLPTWRVEDHWLLDIFFGGRAMTGYHAWVLPCIFLFFHAPLLFNYSWSWRQEARALSCYIIFWIVEDALWFIENPSFGWDKLTPEHAPWHKHWFMGLPSDYTIFLTLGLILYFWSFHFLCKTIPESSSSSQQPSC